MNDPRGPLRIITAVKETESATFVTFDCGHVSRMNQTFAYKLGSDCRCFQCGPHGTVAREHCRKERE